MLQWSRLHLILLCLLKWWKHTRKKVLLLPFSPGSKAHDHAQLMSEFHTAQSSVNQIIGACLSRPLTECCDMGSQRKTFCTAIRLRTQALAKTWDATHQTTGMCGVTDWLNWSFAWGSYSFWKDSTDSFWQLLLWGCVLS